MFNQMQIINGAYSILKVYTNGHNNKEDRQLLEPLTTMVKLAILAYKPTGTKIAISNNRIEFNDPTYLQGVWRNLYGNKKNEVHHLLNPIIKAVKRYDISKPEIKNIFSLAVLGLVKLKATYNNSSSVVCQSLDLHMSIINSALQKEKKQQINGNTSNNNPTDIIFNSVLEDEEVLKHLSIFKNLWTDEEIKLVSNMLNQCKNDEKSINSYIESINIILTMKDEKANELLLQITNKF